MFALVANRQRSRMNKLCEQDTMIYFLDAALISHRFR